MPTEMKTALVTGSGSPTGIGFATAKHLCSAGYRVTITSTSERIRERENELKKLGYDCSSYPADLTDANSVRFLIETVGPIDALVNNAGMAALGQLDKTGPLEEMSDETWAMTINRNLTTAFHVIRAVLPHMKARKWGRIVNIASTTGTVTGIAFDSAYSAAKGGMLGLTRSLSLEVAKYGITVNSVAPGWIATGSQTGAEAQAGLSTPVGRSGTADEVGACAAFLCSPAASYVTGQLLVVDGGNSIVEDKRA